MTLGPCHADFPEQMPVGERTNASSYFSSELQTRGIDSFGRRIECYLHVKYLIFGASSIIISTERRTWITGLSKSTSEVDEFYSTQFWPPWAGLPKEGPV
jgi:hypothetical protein